MEADHKLVFHRGVKSDTVIATGVPCLEKKGRTDIHFIEPKFTVSFEHLHHSLPFTPSRSILTYNGKKYHWKDHHELVEDDTNILLATFHASWLECNGHKIGRLVIKGDGQDMRDLVVITSLIVQERADENEVSVRYPSKCYLTVFRRTWRCELQCNRGESCFRCFNCSLTAFISRNETVFKGSRATWKC